MEVDTLPVDHTSQPEQASAPQLPLNILSTTKTAQLQNGLKHGDYGRYRFVSHQQHCLDDSFG